jgi:hypothetical protein
MDFEGKKSLFARAANLRPQCAQRVDQRFHRSFPHLWHTVDPISAAPGGRTKRGQETRGRAREPDEQLGGLRRNPAAATVDRDLAARWVGFQRETEFRQRIRHQVRVLAEERAGDFHRTLIAERRQQEGAVRDALGAGQRHLPAHGMRERRNGQQVRQ